MCSFDEMPMKVFLCQHDIVWEAPIANHRKVSTLLGSKTIERGSLVILPEMFACGFSLNVAKIAEAKDGETCRFLASKSQELGVFLMAGIVTHGRDGRGRNEAVVFSPEGREMVRYCKMHPFAPGGEAECYEAGESPSMFDWMGHKVAPFICYDLRFPECFRASGRARAELVTVIANWPEARIHHWIRLLQARAIENQCWVAGVNRIGQDPRFSYSGRSVIVNHHGDIVVDAESSEGLVDTVIDFSSIAEYRADKPFLADMRVDLVPPQKLL